MKKTLLFGSALIGVMTLSACSNSNAAPQGNTDPSQNQQNNQAGGPDGGRGPGFGQQNLQQYADEANAAPDKTTLTKDQFMAEMQALMQKQRAMFQQQSGNPPSQGFNGPRFGSGGNRGRSGSGAFLNRLQTAVTFEKYTDPQGNEALIAIDSNGNVVMKFPRMFRQPPAPPSGGQ